MRRSHTCYHSILRDAFVSEDGLMIPWKNEASEDVFQLMSLRLERK